MQITTKEYLTLQELEETELNYGYFISGSDQIWNPVPADFDWAYYLPFVKKGKMVECLNRYDSISVREEGSRKNIEAFIKRNAEIVFYPTLLLDKNEWDKFVSKKEIIKGEYILLYTLFATLQIISIAKYFSKNLKLPIVVPNFTNQYDVINPFKKVYGSGPEEFLWLIKDAKLILTSSFHGTVFSTINEKPFFAINGAQDARISTLLEYKGLHNRDNNVETMKKI